MIRTGLLIVDIQNDYFAGGAMELVGMEAALANAAKLLAGFRNIGAPVYHVQHLAMQPGATFFLPKTEGSLINEAVTPLDGEPVIVKHFPNSFRNTGLEKKLKGDLIEKLVVCGAMSHMCIDATVRAGFDLGFSCTVVQDACATRDLEFEGRVVGASYVHAAFMAALDAAYCEVTDAGRFIANIS